MLIHITTPSTVPRPFCAAVWIKDGVVVEAAPILKYMVGWTQSKVLNYCWVKGWDTENVGVPD